MKPHIELLDQLHSHVGAKRAPHPTSKVTARIHSVGAPVHLRPGASVVDPETGQPAEVVSYHRRHTVAAAAKDANAPTLLPGLTLPTAKQTEHLVLKLADGSTVERTRAALDAQPREEVTQ